MLDLSPTKLIIIFIVVIILLGPKRLPQVARQLGAAWHKLTGFQQQIEHEIRQTLPDLPSSQDIVRFARSPVTMLNQLAQMPNGSGGAAVQDPGSPPPGRDGAGLGDPTGHGTPDVAEGTDAADGTDAAGDGMSTGAAPPEPRSGGTAVREAGRAGLAALADDPSMN